MFHAAYYLTHVIFGMVGIKEKKLFIFSFYVFTRKIWPCCT